MMLTGGAGSWLICRLAKRAMIAFENFIIFRGRLVVVFLDGSGSRGEAIRCREDHFGRWKWNQPLGRLQTVQNKEES